MIDRLIVVVSGLYFSVYLQTIGFPYKLSDTCFYVLSVV